MSANIFSFILISVIVVILLIDLFPIFTDWLSRIYIGRFNDKNIWNKFITGIGVKWLNHTPKIKVTDNRRLVILDMLKGNYTKSAIQHWQEAALLLGLSVYLKSNNDTAATQEVIRFVESKFDYDGMWIKKPQNVDAAILAYSIMKVDFINTDKYKNGLDYIWELIQENIGFDGTVEYRKSMPGYRYVDTVGFICPFLVAYGTRYHKDECIDLAIRQIKDYEQYGMLYKHYIPSHAYKLDNKIPLGLYGWGRGLAWYAIGLIDSWNELPSDNNYKPVLEEFIKKYANAVLNFQQDNGSWNWTVTRSECRPDSSATAVLGWFLLSASIISDISKECLICADKAFNYLMYVTRRNGAVDFSQGDTKDIGVYSMLFNILPFTQGFCIRMANFMLPENKL